MGGIGGSFSGTVKPIVSLPMVICCGRLVVVSSIPPGDFCINDAPQYTRTAGDRILHAPVVVWSVELGVEASVLGVPGAGAASGQSTQIG